MLKRVNAWKIQATLTELRGFMLEQLERSIESDDYIDYLNNKKISKKTGAEWKQSEIEKIQSNVDYHTKELKREQNIVEERNAFVKILFENLHEE